MYASELRSRSGCGRPRVGVGGLWMLSSCRAQEKSIWHKPVKRIGILKWIYIQYKGTIKTSCKKHTCIHVSSCTRSGDVSGDWRGGGKGWINFGTTTNPLPTTSIAPALFAVPKCICHMRLHYIYLQIKREKPQSNVTYHNSWLQKKELSTVPEQTVQTHPWHIRGPL